MSPSSIAAGDWNGDGRTDLAVANFGSNNLSVLFGYGDGTFTPAVSVAYGCGPQALLTGNFTADLKPDLAVVNLGDGSASVAANLAK